MNTKTYTMIDPKQIAKKGFKGCKTTASVQSFCKANKVDCLYWKPQGSTQKIMMIEWNSFQNAYKACKSSSTKTSRTTTSKTKACNSSMTSMSSRSTTRKNSTTRSKGQKTNSTWGSTPTKRAQARRTNSTRRTTKTRRAA